MNKQQLAARIWTSAQKMRSSKIDAQQYKDYLTADGRYFLPQGFVLPAHTLLLPCQDLP